MNELSESAARIILDIYQDSKDDNIDTLDLIDIKDTLKEKHGINYDCQVTIYDDLFCDIEGYLRYDLNLLDRPSEEDTEIDPKDIVLQYYETDLPLRKYTGMLKQLTQEHTAGTEDLYSLQQAMVNQLEEINQFIHDHHKDDRIHDNLTADQKIHQIRRILARK